MFVSRDFGTGDIYSWMSLPADQTRILRSEDNHQSDHNCWTFATCIISAFLKSPPHKDRLNRVGFGVGRQGRNPSNQGEFRRESYSGSKNLYPKGAAKGEKEKGKVFSRCFQYSEIRISRKVLSAAQCVAKSISIENSVLHAHI